MGSVKLDKIKYGTLRDQVAATLRKAILHGDLAPGQALVQDQIAKELNISRMPVREALSLLESEGLITNLPYKGSVVVKFTAQDIKEMYEIRQLLEGYAAELAARNIRPAELAEIDDLMSRMKECLKTSNHEAYSGLDRRFHQIIFESSGNRRLVQLIANTWKSFPMYLAYSIPGRINRSYEEQSKIVAAIKERDPSLAAECCRRQIQTVYREMAPHFEETADLAAAAK